MKFSTHPVLFVLPLLLLAPQGVADDFSDGIFRPRAGLYVASTIGQTFDYQVSATELAGSSDEREFDLDDEQSYTGALGYYFGQFRVEFEASYFETDFLETRPTNSVIDGDLAHLSFLGNIFIDIPTGLGALDFYIGGGLGFSILESEGTFTPPLTFVDGGGMVVDTVPSADETIAVFAAQAMIGLSYEVVENVHFTGGYRLRYFGEGSNNLSENSGLIFREHTVQSIDVGIRIDF